MPNVCNLCIRLVWLCHHKMVTMLQKQHIHFRLGDQIAILCTFLTRKRFTHFICREKWFTHFFCRKSNLRTSSGKFLRVQFCHPESSDFLGLWSKRWGWSPNPNAVPPAGVEYGKHLCAPEIKASTKVFELVPIVHWRGLTYEKCCTSRVSPWQRRFSRSAPCRAS